MEITLIHSNGFQQLHFSTLTDENLRVLLGPEPIRHLLHEPRVPEGLQAKAEGRYDVSILFYK